MVQRNERRYRTHYVSTGKVAGRATLLLAILVVGILLMALLGLLIGLFG